MRSAASMVSRSHFADQHHVGIFTEGGAESIGEALGVGMKFALIDQAVLVHVDEFDRIFDRQNVVVALGIDLVDHRGQRSGLTGARRAGHQHQTARLFAHLGDNGRKVELVEGLDFKGNQTENGGRCSALVEDVAAEAGQTLEPE